MPRIALKVNNYKSTQHFKKKILAIFLTTQAINTNVWAVNIAGNVATVGTTASAPYVITAGTGGSFSVPGIGGSITTANSVLAANIATDATANTLGDYTINVGNIMVSLFGSAPSTIPTVIDMKSAGKAGTISIINGYETSNPAKSCIYCATGASLSGAIMIPSSSAIDFTGATAKLNLTQNDPGNLGNNINGNILGGEGGDTITINGGVVNSNITFGDGTNVLNINNSGLLAGIGTSGYVVNGGKTNNSINLVGSPSIAGTAFITGKINMPTGSTNILNIGTTLAATQYSSGGDIANLQTINIKGPFSGNTTAATISHNVTGVTTLNNSFNCKLTVNGGSISSESGSSLLTNNGSIIVNNLGSISGLDILTNTTFQIDNGKVAYNKSFANNYDLNIINGGDLSGIAANQGTLTNSISKTITVDSNSTIGKYYAIGKFTNNGNFVNQGNSVVDSLVNSATGSVTVDTTGVLTASSTGTGTIVNNGIITVKAGGIINANSITQNGTMTTAGNINSPITFGAGGVILNINSGKIQAITGGAGSDTININGPLSTAGNIIAVENINLLSNVLNVNNNIAGLTGKLNVAVQTTVNIAAGGDISGGGIINNLGTINTSFGATIGATTAMGNFNNYGSFIANGGNVAIANFNNNLVNAALNVSSGNMVVNSLTNTLGSISISAGDLSITTLTQDASKPANYGILTNAPNQAITISQVGTIGASQPFTTVNNSGIINVQDEAVVNFATFKNTYPRGNNNLPISLHITGGKVLIGSSQAGGSIENSVGSITIGSAAGGTADLSSASSTSSAPLINHTGQTVTILGSGTIGNTFPLGSVTNNGLINASGGNAIVGSIINGDLTNNYRATLNINQGTIFAGSINNNLGSINIFSTTDFAGNEYFGDLSSVDLQNPSSLTNGINQIINVASGTIGSNGRLGAVINNGIINVDNNINVGTFDNSLSGSILNVTGGIAKMSDITNSGQIIISSSGNSADVSSVNLTTPSNITNNVGAIITISGSGTIGANGSLGSVNNSGTINADGGNILFHDFNNSNSSSILNITLGNVRIGNIVNTTGKILIQGGDLSSIDQNNHSSFANGSLQTITVSGNGTIGNAANCPLGAITNYGVFQAYGGNITADSFTNSKLGHATTSGSLDLTSGIIRAGSIKNTFGSILINGGDLSGVTYNTSTLTNAADQSITISNNGTIGANNRLGVVTNNGTINAGGGNVSFGDFTNNHAGALLNITSGIVTTGNINNTLGTIQIGNAGSSGDLSGIYDNISNLINAAGQNITVSGYGTVGVSHPLGVITNNGSITATTNKFKAKSLNNNQNAIFNLTNNNPSGTNAGIALQSVNNLGTINIYNNNINANGITDINIAKFNNLGGGVFNVNGSLTINGNLTNNTGATTNMLANVDLVNVANNFTNNGNVSMLSSASILHGNYIVGATGTHTTMINNGAVNKLTLNNGVASLTAGATIDLNTTGSSIVRDKDQFTIISSNNAPIIADVKDINIKGGTRLISYHLSNQNNDIIITANRQSFASVFPLDNSAGTLPTILDNLINSNTQDPYLVAAISYLEQVISDQGIVNGVNQLSPDVGIAEITLATSGTLVPQIISERTEIVARSGIKELRTGYAAGGMQIDDGLWIKGLGGTIEQEERNGFAGYNANSVGVAFGADTRILPNTWIGLGLSSVGTHMKSKDYPAKKTNVSSYQVTVYGSYSPEKYYIDLYGAMAVNNYKTARTIQYINQTASATFTGVQPSAKVAIGYYLNQSNGFKIIPNVSLLSSTLYQNPYNETGASGIGLQKISSTTLSQLELGVGVKFALLDNEDSDQAYKPDLHFMVLHDLKASPQEVTAQFMGGGGSFKVTSATPDKTTYNIGAGVVFMHKNRLHFTANYEWRKKNKFIGHSGSLAVRYEL